MPRVLGGQAFRPSSFPPTKYIESLIRAYCPELQEAFDKERFLEAFNKARHSAFDEEFAKVSRDGVSCGLQLCWCLLDIEPGLTLPLHAHKNLEVAYVLKGVMKERAVSSRIALERLKPSEVDWLDVPASAKVVDASFAAGRCWLGLPGSVHQVYTSKGSEGCMLLMLYSKDCTFIRAASPVISRQLLPSTAEKGTTYHMAPTDCTFIRAASPVISRQLLPSTAEKGTTYHMAPTVRSPASFMSRDPLYAKYRRSGSMRHPAMTVAQVAVKALADCGVRDAILYPGAKCVELLKVVDNNPWGVRGWLCRNEHAGAFMAEAYNKSQGERLDGVPMIVITSQVPTYKQGTAAFQEVPVVELFAPISKGAFYVASAAQVYDTVVSACRLAVSGVNGPVVVDLPEDLQAETVTLPERSSVNGPVVVDLPEDLQAETVTLPERSRLQDMKGDAPLGSSSAGSQPK
uniref:Thiamine pyrophosphate enzyme N-terminal TPP-binding domain-containing protein n=1 Tax=Tetradesmus obliquus TaxID=3088 RepID=A0A383VWT9_TETOB